MAWYDLFPQKYRVHPHTGQPLPEGQYYDPETQTIREIPTPTAGLLRPLGFSTTPQEIEKLSPTPGGTGSSTSPISPPVEGPLALGGEMETATGYIETPLPESQTMPKSAERQFPPPVEGQLALGGEMETALGPGGTPKPESQTMPKSADWLAALARSVAEPFAQRIGQPIQKGVEAVSSAVNKIPPEFWQGAVERANEQKAREERFKQYQREQAEKRRNEAARGNLLRMLGAGWFNRPTPAQAVFAAQVAPYWAQGQQIPHEFAAYGSPVGMPLHFINTQAALQNAANERDFLLGAAEQMRLAARDQMEMGNQREANRLNAAANLAEQQARVAASIAGQRPMHGPAPQSADEALSKSMEAAAKTESDLQASQTEEVLTALMGLMSWLREKYKNIPAGSPEKFQELIEEFLAEGETMLSTKRR